MLLDRRATTFGPRRPRRWVVPVLSALFVPLWSSGFIVGKIATGHMPVPTVMLWRFVIALVVMGAVVAVVRPARPRGRAWLHLAVTALLLQVGQFSFVYTGLSHGVPAGLSSLILGMAPLLVGLLTPLVLATRLGVAPVLGLLIGAGGVYIVLSDELGGGLGAAGGVPRAGHAGAHRGHALPEAVQRQHARDDERGRADADVAGRDGRRDAVPRRRLAPARPGRAGRRWPGSGSSTRQARSR